MGVPPATILVVLERFWVPQGVAKTVKNQQKLVSIFGVFLGCVLEGFLEGFGSQNEAQTIKHHSKNASERGKSRPPKRQRFQEGKHVEKTTENNFLNKNAAKAEL